MFLHNVTAAAIFTLNITAASKFFIIQFIVLCFLEILSYYLLATFLFHFSFVSLFLVPYLIVYLNLIILIPARKDYLHLECYIYFYLLVWYFLSSLLLLFVITLLYYYFSLSIDTINFCGVIFNMMSQLYITFSFPYYLAGLIFSSLKGHSCGDSMLLHFILSKNRYVFIGPYLLACIS